MIRPALVSLVGQDVQEQLQSLLILETLSDVEGAEHHHSPAGNEGLATLLTANYGGQNLVSVVYEHCVVLVLLAIGVLYDGQQLRDVEEDAGILHDLLVLHKASQD